MNWQKRARTGRPRIEDRANTNEARKPWLRAQHVAADLVPPPGRKT